MYFGRVSSASLAVRMKVSRTAVNNWRSGKGEPESLDRISVIAEILGVPAGWLATGEGDEPAGYSGRVAVPGHGTLAIPQRLVRERSNYEAATDRVDQMNELLESIIEIKSRAEELMQSLRDDLKLAEDSIPKSDRELAPEVGPASQRKVLTPAQRRELEDDLADAEHADRLLAEAEKSASSSKGQSTKRSKRKAG